MTTRFFGKTQTSMKTKTKQHLPINLETRIETCESKLEGFRIIKRALEAANLTKEEADKVKLCLSVA